MRQTEVRCALHALGGKQLDPWIAPALAGHDIQVVRFERCERRLQHAEGVGPPVAASCPGALPSPGQCDDLHWRLMHGWLQCSLDPTQKLLGTQHCSATGGGVRSDRLQQQRQELADHAVAAQHGFGRLPILGWPSRVTDDCYCLLDPLARYMLEDLAPQHLIRPRGVEHQHAEVTQQERCFGSSTSPTWLARLRDKGGCCIAKPRMHR